MNINARVSQKCGRLEAIATHDGVTCFHVVQTATVMMMVVSEMNGVIYHSSMGMAIDRTSSRAMCRLEQRKRFVRPQCGPVICLNQYFT